MIKMSMSNKHKVQLKSSSGAPPNIKSALQWYSLPSQGLSGSQPPEFSNTTSLKAQLMDDKYLNVFNEFMGLTWDWRQVDDCFEMLGW